MSKDEINSLAFYLPSRRTTPEQRNEICQLLSKTVLPSHPQGLSLYDYVRESWPHIESAEFVDNWHIGAICEHLQAVSLGEIPRLLINIPPGCSKSLLCSVFWPTWEWTGDPSLRWFFAAYDQQLSTRDSVKCRTLISSSWYQERWGDVFSIVKDQNQKTKFDTDKGGWRLATSVGGHGTGEHPDRIVIDDPHNVKQAESDTERLAAINWSDQTMSTRGVSRSARWVIIMQRLHREDMSAHMLQRGGWTHVCLPMRFEKNRMKKTPFWGWTDPRKEEGELLAEEQFPEISVQLLENNLLAYGTAGQLQQRPVPKGGGMFREDFFNKRVRAAPYQVKWRVRGWDRASTHDGGCFSAGVLLAYGHDGNLYVENVEKGQWEPDIRNQKIKAVALRDRMRYGPKYEPDIVIEDEGGSTNKDANKMIAKVLMGFRVFFDHPTGMKDTRAEPWATQLAAGNVYLVDNGEGEGLGKADWDINSYVQEHCAFSRDPLHPKRLRGRYFDQIDASTMAFNHKFNPAATGAFRVYRRDKKDDKLRIVVASEEHLQTLQTEHRTLLVSFKDPDRQLPDAAVAIPQNALDFLLDSIVLTSPDLQPSELQDNWDSPVQPWNRFPAELVFTPQQAHNMWKMLTKQRTPPAEVLVFSDESADDRRALSAAMAVCDTLRLPRNVIHVLGDDNPNPVGEKDKPQSQHVYDCVKRGRNLVS